MLKFIKVYLLPLSINPKKNTPQKKLSSSDMISEIVFS